MPDVTVLECASPYRTDKVEYKVGQVLHLSPEEAAHLLTDSRESFVVLATTVEGLEQGGEPVAPQTTEEIGMANHGTGEGAEPEASDETAMSTEGSPSSAESESDAGEPEAGEAQPVDEAVDPPTPGEESAETADEESKDEPAAADEPKPKSTRKSRPRR